MSSPKCPKCKGRLVHVPQGVYDTEAIRCIACGWLLQKEEEVVQTRPIKPIVNHAKSKENGKLGGRPKQAPRKPVREVSLKRVFRITTRSKHLHYLKEGERAYCGVTPTKPAKTIEGIAICKNCEKNIVAHERKLAYDRA